jgi:hypothetical protein
VVALANDAKTGKAAPWAATLFVPLMIETIVLRKIVNACKTIPFKSTLQPAICHFFCRLMRPTRGADSADGSAICQRRETQRDRATIRNRNSVHINDENRLGPFNTLNFRTMFGLYNEVQGTIPRGHQNQTNYNPKCSISTDASGPFFFVAAASRRKTSRGNRYR